MAMLRRLDGAVQVGYSPAAPCARLRVAGGCDQLLQEWSLHAVRAGTERRAASLARQRQDRQASRDRDRAAAAEAAAERAERSRAAELQSALAREMDERCAREQICKSADCRLAFAASPELRALRQHCSNVQASQQQAVQLLERQVQEEIDRLHHAALDGATEAKRLQETEVDLARELKKKVQRQQLRRDLQAQVAKSKVERHERQIQERQQDQVLVDQAVMCARTQDEEAFAQRRRAQAEVGEALDRLLQHRAQLRADEVRRAREEEYRDEVWRRRQDDRARSLAAEGQAAVDARQHAVQRIVRELEEVMATDQGLKDLRAVLQAEELELERCQKEEETLHRTLQSRAVAAKDCAEGLQRSEERRREAREAEAHLDREFLKRLTEENRLEHMSAQRRRALLAEHQRANRGFLELRRGRREAERQAEEEELAQHRQDEEAAAHVVEEERRRLMRLHRLEVGRRAKSLSAVGGPSMRRVASAWQQQTRL